MIATILAQTLTAHPETAASYLDAITPALTIASLLYALWQRLRALDYQTMLRAAAVGMRAALDAIPERKAEEIKAGIKEAVGPLNEAMKAEVRKATAPAVAAYREDGLPKLALLPIALALLLLGGCVSGAVHDAAVVARETGAILRKASVPNPAYSDAEKDAWERLWAKQDDALRAIEDGTR